MTEPFFDRRLTPAYGDMAAAHLQGRIRASRYLEGKPRRLVVPIAGLTAEPRQECALDTQVLQGESVVLYEERDGFAFVQLDRDGYVGWLPASSLGADEDVLTHEVIVKSTLLFKNADFRAPVLAALPMGARVKIVEEFLVRETAYALRADGTALIACHLAPCGKLPPADYVHFASQFIGTPYHWGGRTFLGIDCSGLVQTALARTGLAAPRDTDMQEEALGISLPIEDLERARRGDLVFWPGHVGVIVGPNRLLHANGFHMATVEEPLDTALARMGAKGIHPTSLKRLAGVTAEEVMR